MRKAGTVRTVKCGHGWLTVVIIAHQIPQPEEGIGYDDGSTDRLRKYPPLRLSVREGNGRKELEYPPPMILEDSDPRECQHALVS